MNAPDRFELFVLPEGVKKVTITDDTKTPNTATFTIQKEDHTLGNLLCRQMQRQSHVIFAGYKVPHPLEHAFVLKVQTDKTTTPAEALQRGVDQLIGDLSLLEERLKGGNLAMSVNAEGLNAKTLLCPNANCKCVLLKPAHAKFENIEKDHILLPCVTSKADPLTFQETKKVWCLHDMYQFENIGFSKIPPPSNHQQSAGDFRYLCCAACDAGPLGYGFLLGEPPVYHLAVDRVTEATD